MGKILFSERPRPPPETARTAGSCGSAEGHMTPAVSPAFFHICPALFLQARQRPKSALKASDVEGTIPVSKEGTQRLTAGYEGDSCSVAA